jgi:DNA (cytosine-5)-methyltransferase 1
VKLLDLFCGAGGATAGYQIAGFTTTGVDTVTSPNYCGDTFSQADALVYLQRADARLFDAIHASPPCQSFTAYRRRGNGVGDSYTDMIAATREALQATGLPYVIENVEGAPLIDPVRLCGSTFGLDVRRHRLFETNWPLVGAPCNHAWQTPRFPPATNRANLRSTVEVGAYRCHKLAPKAMDIHWMTNDEISEAIPPAYTSFIGAQLAGYLRARSTA